MPAENEESGHDAKRKERRAAGVACGAHALHDGYTDLIYVMLPLWQRDNGRRVARVVVYDPRSLAQVWVQDEATGAYIVVPYRTPHPDMTLAESEAARARLRSLRTADRTEGRLFESLAGIRRIEAEATTATARKRAERAREGQRSAAEARTRRGEDAPPAAAPPAFPTGEAEPFSEVEVG